MTNDEEFIGRAIGLAMKGRGRVEPNPMVGCVLVKEGRVIGEGYHEQFGGPHAEPAALANCRESPSGATAYVTLEPCCHSDKKTPPCVPKLIEAGIARVVIGCLDPNPQVNGRGAAMLREAGVVVDGPVLEAECRQLIAPFIAHTVYGRPYVTLKWAQSSDGLIAGSGGRRMQISSPDATRAIHGLRARCDAILVGAATALNDDPLLTARGVPDARPLIRAVADPHLRMRPDLKLVRTAREGLVVIYHGPDVPADDPRLRALHEQGVRTATVADLKGILADLHADGVTHLLVESGRRLAAAFVEANLADRIWVIRSPDALGIADAPRAIPMPHPPAAQRTIGPDIFVESLNPGSDAFYASVPSADWALMR